MDQETIAALAHNTENLLIEIREGRATLADERLDLVFEAAGLMRRMLNDAQRAFAAGLTVVPPTKLLPLIEALGHAVHGTSPSAAAPAQPEAPRAKIRPKVKRSEPVEKPAGPTRSSKHAPTLKETIKVDLARVDDLVELIGELVIVEAMVANAPEIVGLHSHRVRNFMSQLSKIIRDLQRQGLGLRMVPLKGVFQKMSRLVRDLSKRNGKKVNFHAPSVDVTFDSVAKTAGANAIAAILTGMGDDGAKGMLTLRRAGARTFAQDAASCVVYGMPKAAMSLGGVQEQIPLDTIAARMIGVARTHRAA